MARFEMTISGGERIIVDDPDDGISEFLSKLQSSDFLLLNEIRGSSSGGTQEVIVASRQIMLVRVIDSDSRQSTTFRPKR
jgi:hypothetical protein